jgi:hypothetical protein
VLISLKLICCGDRIFVLVHVEPNQNDLDDETNEMPDVDLAIRHPALQSMCSKD